MGIDTTYAIGDIHGHLDKLRDVHELIAADKRENGDDGVIVHIGDLVDRGPDSAGVISWLMAGLEAGEPWVVLKGNHDRMMSYYLEEIPRRDHRLRAEFEWLHPRLGGQTTLASYGIDPAQMFRNRGSWVLNFLENIGLRRAIQNDEGSDFGAQNEELHQAAIVAVPVDHLRFLSKLETVYECGKFVFVHAGIRPGVALAEQAEDDLVWIRDEFSNDRRDHGFIVVHGHTPIDVVRHFGNRVNIDTGAAYGGPLSVIVMEGNQIWQLGPKGRTPVLPE